MQQSISRGQPCSSTSRICGQVRHISFPRTGRMVTVRQRSQQPRNTLVQANGDNNGTQPKLAASTSSTKGAGNSGALAGYAALFGVAVLWGSYTPALRVLYEVPLPPDPPLLNALQAVLSALFLVTANVTASISEDRSEPPHPERSNPIMAEDGAVRDLTLQKDAATASTSGSMDADESASGRRPASNPIEAAVANALNWRSSNLVLAGGEIGMWMCLAFGLEVAGVQLTSATKAAFLNQVSVLITPLLVHLSGEHVRGVEWIACGLGLMGSALVAADSLMSGGAGGMEGGSLEAAGVTNGDGSVGNESLGLLFVVISAIFFALSTVRLGRYSSQFDSLKLSTASTVSLGLFSIAWVVASIIGHPEGAAHEVAVVHGMLANPACLATLLWVGLGPGALAAFLQATGQKVVPPAQAQVIYSTTPLWAAGFAFAFLDASDEAMGRIAWAGAALMLTASLMTATSPPTPPAVAVDSDPQANGVATNGVVSSSTSSRGGAAGGDQELALKGGVTAAAASNNGRPSRGGSVEAAGKSASHLLGTAGPQSVVVASMDQDTRDRQGIKDMV